MENKLKSFFIMYWYLRRTFFFLSQRQDQNLWKEKEKEEKNVRICSPSLALKKQTNCGALERCCCWSFQVPICVPAPCDPPPSDPRPLSFLCWTPTRRAVNHLQVPWGGVTESNTWQVVTSQKPHLPVPQRQIKDWHCCIFDTPPLAQSQYQNVEWLSEMQLILWLPKALQANIA